MLASKVVPIELAHIVVLIRAMRHVASHAQRPRLMIRVTAAVTVIHCET